MGTPVFHLSMDAVQSVDYHFETACSEGGSRGGQVIILKRLQADWAPQANIPDDIFASKHSGQIIEHDAGQVFGYEQRDDTHMTIE
jgi:hypothetical protein